MPQIAVGSLPTNSDTEHIYHQAFSSTWKCEAMFNSWFPIGNCWAATGIVMISIFVHVQWSEIWSAEIHMSGTCPISCLRGCYRNTPVVPSGKRLHHYGKSPFFMGKSTINGPFSIANCLFTGGYHISDLSMRHVHLGIAVPSKPSRRERKKQRGSCRIQNRVEKSSMSQGRIWMCCFSYISSLFSWPIDVFIQHLDVVWRAQKLRLSGSSKNEGIVTRLVHREFVTGVNYQVWGYVFICK